MCFADCQIAHSTTFEDAALLTDVEHQLCCLCLCLQFNNTNYASIRAHTWFNGVTNTVYRDVLFNGTREAMCKGGYSKTLYSNVAKLMSDNTYTVSNNSEYDYTGHTHAWQCAVNTCLCVQHSGPCMA